MNNIKVIKLLVNYIKRDLISFKKKKIKLQISIAPGVVFE
jgi:hypothetical protein